MRNILITGHNGYIGPHMIEILKTNSEVRVFGCDINLFRDVAWRALPQVMLTTRKISVIYLKRNCLR